MSEMRHTRQRLVVAGLTVAALPTGALLGRTELIEKTLELGRVRQGDRAYCRARTASRHPQVHRSPRDRVLLGPDRYFDGMVDTVNRDEGTVNKYNGDNIPVLRSAPLVSFGFAMGYQ
jgi:hypothetical protein